MSPPPRHPPPATRATEASKQAGHGSGNGKEVAGPSAKDDHSNHTRPRIVLYHQTLHDAQGRAVSVLPLARGSPPPITHLILAALHINTKPGDITLNDDQVDSARHEPVWQEVAELQRAGIKVLIMVGGAAKGSFARLDHARTPGSFPADAGDEGDGNTRHESQDSEEAFDSYYAPLRDILVRHRLDGIDLDVEEPMSLPGIVRLIQRLRLDFGPDFLITLAPVATALAYASPDPLHFPAQHHLSGFDYDLLEATCGDEIAWYNTQFYNGWGSLETFADYDLIMQRGWKRDKVVVGVLTNKSNGPSGYVEWTDLLPMLMAVQQFYDGQFGGVMGWEYFNAQPRGEEQPWQWAFGIQAALAQK